MIANNNLYGSYYSSLLTGVNLISGPARPASSTRGASAAYNASKYYEGIDLSSAKSLYGVKTGISELKSVINNLMGPSLFTKHAPVSSNLKAVSVSGSMTGTAPGEDISVSVKQLAGGQRNEGQTLFPDSRVVSGTYKFEIEAEGTKHQFTIELTPGETNKDLQSKMAEAVNSRGISVEASLEEGDQKSTLTLYSRETGDTQKATFSIRDIVGSAVGRTGVGVISEPAHDAIFTVNGERQTSPTNSVSLSKHVEATLKEITSEAVTISMRSDPTAAVQTISNMAATFSNLIEGAQSSGSLRIYKDLSSASKAYAKSLERLGISVDDDGAMSLDRAKVFEAVEQGSLETAIRDFKRTGYGFTQKVSRVINGVGRNPAGYTSKGTFSQFLGAGLYFNMMV